MTIEHAVVQAKRKPWGSTDLLPWSETLAGDEAIGELWFQRRAAEAPVTKLLLKLLFTTQPLSIQVHPDDVFARSIGLANGKTEAWYILSAAPVARVAIGLKKSLSPPELRAAISDGSIAGLVQWRQARRGDVVFVPAGTIHAIGAGIVLAEIQQQSDATFRLFDYGRQRELHLDNAVAAARAEPAQPQATPKRLNEARLALVISPHFVLERIDLAANSVWSLDVRSETWLLVIGGNARIGSVVTTMGQAVFVEADRVDIRPGGDGMVALLAYPGPTADAGALRQTAPEAKRSVKREAQVWPL